MRKHFGGRVCLAAGIGVPRRENVRFDDTERGAVDDGVISGCLDRHAAFALSTLRRRGYGRFKGW